jgi:hypothetical protein
MGGMSGTAACGGAQDQQQPAAAYSYTLSYRDGSYSRGVLAHDRLSLAGEVIDGFVFGCGTSNQGPPFGGTSGLMGLGRSQLSLVSQTMDQFGGVLLAAAACRISRPAPRPRLTPPPLAAAAGHRTTAARHRPAGRRAPTGSSPRAVPYRAAKRGPVRPNRVWLDQVRSKGHQWSFYKFSLSQSLEIIILIDAVSTGK